MKRFVALVIVMGALLLSAYRMNTRPAMHKSSGTDEEDEPYPVIPSER